MSFPTARPTLLFGVVRLRASTLGLCRGFGSAARVVVRKGLRRNGSAIPCGDRRSCSTVRYTLRRGGRLGNLTRPDVSPPRAHVCAGSCRHSRRRQTDRGGGVGSGGAGPTSVLADLPQPP